MTLFPLNKNSSKFLKCRLGLIAAIPLVMLHSANSATINWSNGATDNVGWHTAANWSGGVLPGRNANDLVLLAGNNDTPYVTVAGMTIANPVKILIRHVKGVRPRALLS